MTTFRTERERVISEYYFAAGRKKGLQEAIDVCENTSNHLGGTYRDTANAIADAIREKMEGPGTT